MRLKTAIKVVLVLICISVLLRLGSGVSDIDVISLLVQLFSIPLFFILLVYIPSLLVILMVKLFPKHKESKYFPAVLVLDGFLFFTHLLFFNNSVNKDFFDMLSYITIVILLFIAFISSFIAAKINYPIKELRSQNDNE